MSTRRRGQISRCSHGVHIRASSSTTASTVPATLTQPLSTTRLLNIMSASPPGRSSSYASGSQSDENRLATQKSRTWLLLAILVSLLRLSCNLVAAHAGTLCRQPEPSADRVLVVILLSAMPDSPIAVQVGHQLQLPTSRAPQRSCRRCIPPECFCRRLAAS